MIRVNGSLVKTRLTDADGYKYSVSPKYRYFNDIMSAIYYAIDIYDKTGVKLEIIVTTRNYIDKKKLNHYN